MADQPSPTQLGALLLQVPEADRARVLIAIYGRPATSDDLCNNIIVALDRYARNHGSFEYGLPVHTDDCWPAMREVIRSAIEAAP